MTPYPPPLLYGVHLEEFGKAHLVSNKAASCSQDFLAGNGILDFMERLKPGTPLVFGELQR